MVDLRGHGRTASAAMCGLIIWLWLRMHPMPVACGPNETECIALLAGQSCSCSSAGREGPVSVDKQTLEIVNDSPSSVGSEGKESKIGFALPPDCKIPFFP